MTSQNRLTIVCGNAGTGKTTYGRKLAAQERALFLDIDTVSESLVKAGLRALGHDPNDRDSPRFKELFREAIHETLFAVARDNLPVASVIIVAPFTTERRRVDFKERVQLSVGVPVEIHYVTCEEKVRRARIVQRNNPRDAQKLRNWDAYSEAARDETRPPFPHVLVDTTSPFEGH